MKIRVGFVSNSSSSSFLMEYHQILGSRISTESQETLNNFIELQSPEVIDAFLEYLFNKYPSVGIFENKKEVLLNDNNIKEVFKLTFDDFVEFHNKIYSKNNIYMFDDSYEAIYLGVDISDISELGRDIKDVEKELIEHFNLNENFKFSIYNFKSLIVNKKEI